ncbi:MAG: DUF6473 family protein [Pseudomonadota bacterium]
MDMWQGQTALDLAPCRYGYSQLLFRGPPADLDEPYIAFIGGTETVAPLVPHPFCEIVADELGLECVNLGIKNAGVDVFLQDPEILRIANGAEMVVIEVIGAANQSNNFYNVHPRRNDRFTRPRRLLRMGSKRLDLTEVHFTGHLHAEIQKAAPSLHNEVVADCQSNWNQKMHQLIAAIERPVHLLRFAQSTASPSRAPFVDPDMVAGLATVATTLTRVEPSKEALEEGTRGLFFAAMQAAMAGAMLPASVHAETAQALIETISAAGHKKARAG